MHFARDRFFDLVDLWVIQIKKAMILCARSTSRSREQNTKRTSYSENMIVKDGRDCIIIKHSRHITGVIHEVRKGLWASFLDCAFQILIGWAGKLGSHG